MPFSTDVNWPQRLLNIFKVSRKDKPPLESRYYGSYDWLLNYAMVDSDDPFILFVDTPTAPDERTVRDTADFVVFMVVSSQECKPVLFIEIKDDEWVNKADNRWRADAQMPKRYRQMLGNCPIHKLYGLSLLGTSLRVYCGDKVTGEVTPDIVDRPDEELELPHNFLEGQWDLDILSPDGFKKMQEIVTYIKAEVANVVGQ